MALKTFNAIVFALFVAFNCYAQGTSKLPKLTFGLGGSCHFSLLENHGKEQSHKDLLKLMRENEKLRLAFSAQIPFSYRFSNWGSFTSGLQIYQYGIKTDIRNVILQNNTNPDNNDTMDYFSNSSIYFIDIPLLFDLTYYRRAKLSVFTSVGFSGCLFIGQHDYYKSVYTNGVIFENSTNGNGIDSFRDYYFTINARTGIDLLLKKNLSVRIAAEYKRFVFFYKMNEQHPIKRVPYIIGLNVALCYNLTYSHKSTDTNR